MTGLMEVIVRPFAPVVITPPAQAPREAAVVVPPIAFSLGGKGGRSMSLTFDIFRTVVIPNQPNKFKESARESTKVHVENEDDPDQFVEFCRADKVKFTPADKGEEPQRGTTYDAHELSDYLKGGGTIAALQARDAANFEASKDSKKEQTYNYKYPTDKKTCKSPAPPPGPKECTS